MQGEDAKLDLRPGDAKYCVSTPDMNLQQPVLNPNAIFGQLLNFGRFNGLSAYTPVVRLLAERGRVSLLSLTQELVLCQKLDLSTSFYTV